MIDKKTIIQYYTFKMVIHVRIFYEFLNFMFISMKNLYFSLIYKFIASRSKQLNKIFPVDLKYEDKIEYFTIIFKNLCQN